eukprot:1719359-Rhodomonas_salina.1
MSAGCKVWRWDFRVGVGRRQLRRRKQQQPSIIAEHVASAKSTGPGTCGQWRGRGVRDDEEGRRTTF